MNETELWEWMMDGNYPPGYDEVFIKLDRKAFATLSRDVVFEKWQGHGKKDKKETIPAGTRVKVVMASRMGDVGITDNLNVDNGYHYRVNCIEGEWDMFGDGKQVLPLKPADLLLDIEPIEDPDPEKIKKAYPEGIKRLECWTTLDGVTVCAKCSAIYTGSKPVALMPPRQCRECKEFIEDEWPSDSPEIFS